MMRTHYCGAVTEKDTGKSVTVCGWVKTSRDMGGVIFIDVHDREGTLQVVCNASIISMEGFETAERIHTQSVVKTSGKIRIRDSETYNDKLKTGTIELAAESLELISDCARLPFEPDDLPQNQVREDLRLKYRFIDLRRDSQINNLKFRHRLLKVIRDFLDERDFIEVETPYLTKSTPEGARDYIVPSRIHPGTFYALPQSPQIFKQLLMVGGIDKYYQTARCFRDEDLRADRQPEFTQVDMELSFVSQEDILKHLESLFRYIFKKMMPHYELSKNPFRRMTWTEAMDIYGSDKPDTRFDIPIYDITEIAETSGFEVFRNAAESGGVVRAVCIKGKADFSRTEIEDMTRASASFGAKGMAWISLRKSNNASEKHEVYSILTKFMSESEIDSIIEKTHAEAGDFIFFCADKLPAVRKVLGNMRLLVADMLGLRSDKRFEFVIVTDFPQFEYSESEHRYTATHHPFTMPYEEDIPYLLTDTERVRAQAYDFVLNGIELGSGSIRIHDSEIQKMMFTALGFDDEEIEERFRFMVNAFRYGTPPHGGFAFGLDRLVMILTGAKSLRDVIAFPKLGDASCPLTDAPSPVDKSQLDLLGLSDALEEGGTDKIRERRKKAEKVKYKIDIDIVNVAKLAMFPEKNSEESELMKESLIKIVSLAEEMNSLNLTSVKPDEPDKIIFSSAENVFRDDVCKNVYSRDELIICAPDSENGYIKVPKVLE